MVRDRKSSAHLDADGIEREFDRTASRYDLMVALNPGYHDHLRMAAKAIADSIRRDRAGVLVDLGCGSGASTAALVNELDGRPLRTMLGLDASAGMIAQARTKSWPSAVRFERRRAEELDAAVAVQSVDGVLACYLFRNVADPDAVLAEVFRTLRPGGCLVVQDYTLERGSRAVLIWSVVCWLAVIPLSLLLTGRTRLYRYLWRSVLAFDSADRFERRLDAAGFAPVAVSAVAGWQAGILHTFVAYRPPQ